ncbi:RDD family protein [mine drainage metagenome]|uniref:RDD family protein n=1 Tax=mine drainage metagenome TaxID=410659 RepID=A0A1J5S0E2_9ZZZZ
MERYHTILRRIAAWLIDFVPFLPVLVVGGIFYRYSYGTALGIAWSVAMSVSSIAYRVYFHGRYGATPGKSVMRVRVVSVEKEEKIGFRCAIMRDSPWVVMGLLSVIEDHWCAPNSASVISILTSCWLLLDNLVMLIHPKRRAIHDLIGSTVVVMEGPNQSPEPTPTAVTPAAPHPSRQL